MLNTKRSSLKLLIGAGLAGAHSAWAQPVQAKPEEIAGGLNHPWSVAVMPDGRYLVTERSGRLLLIDAAGKKLPIEGMPQVRAQGQGGLLDIVLSPSFERDATVFFSYSEPVGASESRTAVAKAVLKEQHLIDTQVIFRQTPAWREGYHFGSRLVFDREGHLFVTTGDRYFLKDRAQTLDSHIGKVLRVTVNGQAAPGNPFVNTPNALPEIWSYGHRNMQGAALHPLTGQLWTNEHGAMGGDEVNLCLPGKNYGWPVITHGVDYSGAKIGEGRAKEGLEQPLHFWVPSIAVSGLCFDPVLTKGETTVLWVGGLRSQLLAKLSFEKSKFVKEVRFLTQFGERIRDVRALKDGRLLLLTDSAQGKLLVMKT